MKRVDEDKQEKEEEIENIPFKYRSIHPGSEKFYEQACKKGIQKTLEEDSYMGRVKKVNEASRDELALFLLDPDPEIRMLAERRLKLIKRYKK